MKKFEAHILLVDDDDRIRDLVKQYLNEKNYLVTTATDAEDAQKKVKIIKFDLIVLDIMMPGQNGLDFISENKKKMELLKKSGTKLIKMGININKYFDLKEVLFKLKKFGYSRIFLESGIKLMTSFLKEKLVDDFQLFISPRFGAF